MGILDDAIRQHLDLKRRLGADENDVQKLEDEAFGPPSRPGDPDFPERDDQATGEQAAEAESSEESAGVEPPIAPAADPAPPTVESAVAKPTTEEPQLPAEPSAAEFSDPDEPPTSSHEPDMSVVDQPTMLYDHTADEEQEPPAPPEPAPPTVEAPEVQEPPPVADESPPVEEPPSAELKEPAGEDQAFDLDSLDLDLDDPEPVEAVEPMPPVAEPEPPHQTEPPPPEPTDAEAAELGEGEPVTSSFEPAPATSEQAIADGAPEEEDYEDVPEPGEEPGEDVLDQTPEFLRDQPEDDELWFEQGEPKDFDF